MILSNFPTKTITPESIGAIPNPSGGTAGQVLTKTADGSAWENAPSGLPDGGTEGQMLYKAADGAAWGDKPVMWVRITYGPGNTTADKTFTEIKAAYDSGAYVCAYIGGGWDYPGVLQLKTIGTSYARFSTAGGGTYAGVEDDDVWTVGFTNLIDEDQLNTAINEVQENVENVLPSGGTTGQVLTKTSTGEEWSDAPSGLPEGGTEGQILEKTSSGAAWVDAPESGLTQEQADERYLQLSGGTINQDFFLSYGTQDEYGAKIALTQKGGRVTSKLATNNDLYQVSVSEEGVEIGSEAPEITVTSSGFVDLFGQVSFYDYNGKYLFTLGDYEGLPTIMFNSALGAIKNLTGPADDTDAANKAYVDSHPVYHAGTSAPSNTNLLWIDTNATTGGLKYYNGSSWVHVPVAYS